MENKRAKVISFVLDNHGNIDNAISFAKSTNLCPGMLVKSRFKRRIHSIFELIINMFSNIAELIKELIISYEYLNRFVLLSKLGNNEKKLF